MPKHSSDRLNEGERVIIIINIAVFSVVVKSFRVTSHLPR